MCRPTQWSAARGHNSEGSFQFMKTCWVQLLLSQEFTSVRLCALFCFSCLLIGLLLASSFACPQLTYWLSNRDVVGLKKQNKTVWMINAKAKVGLISVFETRKCENVADCTGLLNAIQMASHCNISSISVLWRQESVFDKATGLLGIWVLEIYFFFFQNFNTDADNAWVCLLWASVTVAVS